MYYHIEMANLLGLNNHLTINKLIKQLSLSVVNINEIYYEK